MPFLQLLAAQPFADGPHAAVAGSDRSGMRAIGRMRAGFVLGVMRRGKRRLKAVWGGIVENPRNGCRHPEV